MTVNYAHVLESAARNTTGGILVRSAQEAMHAYAVFALIELGDRLPELLVHEDDTQVKAEMLAVFQRVAGVIDDPVATDAMAVLRRDFSPILRAVTA